MPIPVALRNRLILSFAEAVLARRFARFGSGGPAARASAPLSTLDVFGDPSLSAIAAYTARMIRLRPTPESDWRDLRWSGSRGTSDVCADGRIRDLRMARAELQMLGTLAPERGWRQRAALAAQLIQSTGWSLPLGTTPAERNVNRTAAVISCHSIERAVAGPLRAYIKTGDAPSDADRSAANRALSRGVVRLPQLLEIPPGTVTEWKAQAAKIRN